MIAADLERLAASAPLAAGYRFELLTRAEVPALIDRLWTWHPDISVGGASCYLQEQYYWSKVFFADAQDQESVVLSLKHGDELVGMFSYKPDPATQSIYAGLGVAAPDHHGANLAHAGMTLVEAVARHLGMGFIFGMVTLKHPYAQRACERAGWQLIGITPGYDRELVAPGVVKRVYEAIYAKVLEADDGLLFPQLHNLTPRTQALFDSIFRSRS
jgi:hypothetical protein